MKQDQELADDRCRRSLIKTEARISWLQITGLEIYCEIKLQAFYFAQITFIEREKPSNYLNLILIISCQSGIVILPL